MRKDTSFIHTGFSTPIYTYDEIIRFQPCWSMCHEFRGCHYTNHGSTSVPAIYCKSDSESFQNPAALQQQNQQGPSYFRVGVMVNINVSVSR